MFLSLGKIMKTSSIKKIVALLLLLFFSFMAWSEDSYTIPNQFLSFDSKILVNTLKTGGIGFGLQYEHGVSPRISLTGNFGHSCIYFPENRLFCLTVRIGLGVNFYSNPQNFLGLYGGFGSQCDFINFAYLNASMPPREGKTSIALTTTMGYKTVFMKKFFTDFYLSVLYYLPNSDKELIDFSNTFDFNFGVRFKILKKMQNQ